MSDNLNSKLNLDSRNLERDVLTAEQRRENCDSRRRVKIAKKRSSSPEVTPKFKSPTTSFSETPYYQALERLAKLASEWMTLKKTLTQAQGAEALKKLTNGNQLFAASLSSNLTSGTLGFISDITKLSKSKLQSTLHNLLDVFCKILDEDIGKRYIQTFQ